MPAQGTFVVVEGIDRAGKSTVVKTLVSELRQSGMPAVAVRFPDLSTPVGQAIETAGPAAGARALHLLHSANRWEAQARIAELLDNGHVVVADRYDLSGTAYSMAASELPLDWCRAADAGLIQPDLVIFLEVDPADAATRPGYGTGRYENLPMQRRVSDVYEQLLPKTAVRIKAGRGRSAALILADAWDAATGRPGSTRGPPIPGQSPPPKQAKKQEKQQ